MNLLSVDDLFMVGIALDMTGAWLLARGLVRRVRLVAGELETAVLVGDSARGLLRWAEERIDAEFGVSALLGGFTIQAAAYLATIAGAGTPDRGAGPAIIAVALALLAAGVVLLVHRYVRPRRRYRLLRDLVMTQRGWHKASLLTTLALSLGHDALPFESDRAWATRVFRVNLPPEPSDAPQPDAPPEET